MDTTGKTADLLLIAIRQHPDYTMLQYANELGISESGVDYHLRAFKKKGIIERRGGNKGGKWIVLD